MQKEFGKDTELTVRMTITVLLLGLVYGAFIWILLSLGAGVGIMLVLVGGLVFVQIMFSDRLILTSMRAKIVTPQEAPHLHSMVEELCRIAGISKPKLAVSKLEMPNAFAAGRKSSSATIAVTEGLINLLNEREMRAVLAHEVTHLKNRDVSIMTIASFFSVVASTLMSLFFWMGLFGGFSGRGRQGGGNVMMIAYIVTIVVWVISLLLISALSRYREFSADRGAAIITGRPDDLIQALTRISGSVRNVPQQDLRKAESMNAFFILPAVGGTMSRLFSTHPSLDKRIERLRSL